MAPRKRSTVAGLVVGVLAASSLLAVTAPASATTEVNDGTVVVHPDEYSGAIKNPLMGFSGKDFRVNTTGPTGSSDQPLDHQPWATTMMTYIPWDFLENDESDTVQDMKDYLDERWRGKDSNGVWHTYEEMGIKAIPRIYLRFPSSDGPYFGLGGDHWPDDMTTGDFTSAQFDARLKRFVQRLAEVMDNDDRVAYVQMGVFGLWGEQHGTAQPTNIEKYFAEYFQNKHVQVRYHHKDQWSDVSQFGIYNDSFGDLLGSTNWATKPVGGEPAYDYNGQDIHGGLVRDTYLNQDLNYNMANMIRSTHSNYLTWVGEYTYGSSWGSRDFDGRQVYLANKALIDDRAELLQQQFGYRYVMNEFSYPESVDPGEDFSVSFTVTNKGSSPMYYDWPVEVSLRDPDTNEVVWRDTFDDVDITDWQPGSGITAWNKQRAGNWSTGVLNYSTPAQPNTETGTFTLPADLPEKDYTIQLAVLDPGGNVPSLRFSMKNYVQGGYHPMGQIGVGAAPATVAVDPASFDSPAVDVSLRYYADGETPAAPAFLDSVTLTSDPVLLAEGGTNYDLGSLRITGEDTNGTAHVLDATSPTWTVTSGASHVELNGSVIKPLTAGTVSVTATIDGVTSAPFTLEVSDEVGDIAGTVKSASGTALSASKVTATNGTSSFETTADANGAFTFLHLPVDEYTISATRTNFTGEPLTVSVVKGQSIAANITLNLVTGGDFFDDFEDGAGAWTAGTGTWSSAGGVYTQTKVGGSNAWRYGSAITGKVWDDATYEADISFKSGGDWAGFIFRKTTQAGTVNDTGYSVLWGKDGHIELNRSGSTITKLKTVQLGTDWAQPHHLKVVTSGPNIKVYVDGGTTPVIDVNDDKYTFGYAGVVTSGSVWAFDNVRVTEPTEAPADAFSVSTQQRCVAGKSVLAVTTVNDTEGPASFSVATPFGTKAFTDVASAKSGFHAFTTRAVALPAGSVTVSGTVDVDGTATTVTQTVDYPAATC